MIYLPVRPRPYFNESWRGYLLRVGTVNGSTCEKDFLKVFGHSKESITTLTPEDCESTYSLSVSLRVPSEQLFQAFDYRSLQPLVEANPFLLRTTPRICPQCLSDEPYLREDWDITPLVLCASHKTLLQDECLHCKTLLTWNRPHFLECGECGSLLAEWPEITPTAECFEKIYMHFVDKSFPHGIQWILDLHRATNTVARAADFFPPSIPFESMPNKLLVELYEQATRFLISKSRTEQIHTHLQNSLSTLKALGRQSLDQRPQLESDYCAPYAVDTYVPPIQFSELRNSRLSYAIRFGTSNNEKVAQWLWVTPHRVRKIAQKDLQCIESSLCFQVSWPHIASLVGVDPKRDRSFLKLLPTIAKRHYWEDVFNLPDVLALLEKVPVQKPPENVQSKVWVAPLFDKKQDGNLAHFAANQAELFNSALNKHPPECYRLSENGGFEGLVIDHCKVRDLLEDRLLSLTCGLSRLELAQIFSVDVFSIDQLIEMGHLQATTIVADSSTRMEILNSSWQSFYRRYLVLNRWCRPYILFAARCVPKLRKHNVCPAIVTETSPGNRRLFAYHRTPELDEALKKLP